MIFRLAIRTAIFRLAIRTAFLVGGGWILSWLFPALGWVLAICLLSVIDREISWIVELGKR